MEHPRGPRRTTRIGSLLGVTSAELPRLIGLMALFFIVVGAVGILRPIKNALALDGLGSTDFYRVYLVSAAVVAFVPVFNRLADRLPWRSLFALVAGFFALNLVAFRLVYVDGSALFGLVFYGWYDLFAAALVTQFFMATQFYFDARSARRAYPVVIAGGSIGATLGGAVTGLFAQSLGTPNLLLVAAALIGIFAAGIPWVLPAAPSRDRRAPVQPRGSIAELLRHRQVRFIAAAVLITVVVKQLVDYQFNAISKEVFVTRDAISAFQGQFNAATQWLPLVVLAGLRPALRRWGVGIAVLLLPAVMFGATAVLALTFGLAAAVLAKGADTSLRYSADRAGREILYVPVPEHIKLRAKAWIDVAIEKGLGKVTAALLIMILLRWLRPAQLAWVTCGLAAAWLGFALMMRREYVRTLAAAVEGRFASLRGVFASLIDATTLPLLRTALRHPLASRASFALDLVGQLPDADVPAVAADLNALLLHDREHIRHAAAGQLLRAPHTADLASVRQLLRESSDELRTVAVRLLLAGSADGAAELRDLLTSTDPRVRIATLNAVLGNGHAIAVRDAGAAYVAARRIDDPADPDARAEQALAAGALQTGDPRIDDFLDDPEPRVRSAALRSAALLQRRDRCTSMIAALGHGATRQAARDALALLGEEALPELARVLLDTGAEPRIRRAIPAALARIPSQRTVDIMLDLVLARETDQLLDFRTIRALGRLRARHPELVFDADRVFAVAAVEAAAAARYAAAAQGDVTGPPPRRTGPTRADGSGVRALLEVALCEAWHERREAVFRCIALLHEPEGVRRAWAAVSRGTPPQRATAVEWIEQLIGAPRFRDIVAVLEPAQAPHRHVGIEALTGDSDSFIALLADSLLTKDEDDVELIEKVFLLQQVDLLRETRSAHVALLASIAEVVDVGPGAVILRDGEAADAMYVVTRGTVELRGVGQHLVIGQEQAFGTWALIDDQPSQVEARAADHVQLLRVTRADFQDLLADHPEIGISMLRGLGRRIRAVVA